MVVLSNYLEKIPVFGRVYKNNYFAWKRAYVNFLRNTGLRPGPVVVHWLATYCCNCNCVYCEASANEVKCDELTTEQIKGVLDELGELRVRHFFVSGGEPLMRRDLLEVLEHAKNRGMTVGMITNSLFFERYQKQIKAAGLKSVWTSVDGLDGTHDKNRGYPRAFEITLDAIRFYKEIGIPLRVVNTMVHPGNLDEMPELLEKLREAGINRWRLSPAIPVGRGTEDKWILSSEQFRRLFRFVEETRQRFDVELTEELGYLGCWDTKTRNSPFICPSGIMFCVVMPDGSVLPCQVVYDTKYSEGNVKKTSFREIWRNGFRAFRYVKLEGECAHCIHRQACSGGCWGRTVTEGKCIRNVWDHENYPHG